jgi:hypothetical protein
MYTVIRHHRPTHQCQLIGRIKRDTCMLVVLLTYLYLVEVSLYMFQLFQTKYYTYSSCTYGRSPNYLLTKLAYHNQL